MVDAGDSNVSVISDTTNSVVATVIGVGFYDAVYDPARSEVFVANGDANTTSVISDSNNSGVATVNVGDSPLGEAYDSAKGEVFVSNSNDNTPSRLSPMSARHRPPLPQALRAGAGVYLRSRTSLSPRLCSLPSSRCPISGFGGECRPNRPD